MSSARTDGPAGRRVRVRHATGDAIVTRVTGTHRRTRHSSGQEVNRPNATFIPARFSRSVRESGQVVSPRSDIAQSSHQPHLRPMRPRIVFLVVVAFVLAVLSVTRRTMAAPRAIPRP